MTPLELIDKDERDALAAIDKQEEREIQQLRARFEVERAVERRYYARQRLELAEGVTP